MRLKKFGALFLAGAMMTGTIGVMSPTQVKADTSANTYTMKVPENVDIQNSGWNSLGNIQITGSVDSGKKVTVTAATTNDFALKNGNNSVSYTLKKAENDTNATTSFEFDAASINAEGGASQAIGVDVADFSGNAAGTYTDTITFTGTMSTGTMSEELAWSETDMISIDVVDSTYLYTISLVSMPMSENTAWCDMYKKDEVDAQAQKLEFNLQKKGNVFTFTSKDSRADFDFTINFSNKECIITRNPLTYTITRVHYVKKESWPYGEYWVEPK